LQESNELITLIHANVNAPDCQPNRTVQLISIDTANQLVAVHVSVGVVQLISYEISGNDVQFKKAFPLKIMELEILDMSFIDSVRTSSSSSNATLAVLHNLPMKLPRVKTYEVVKTANIYNLLTVNYAMTDLSADTNQIVRVPGPRGGFLILSSDRIIYSNPCTNIIRKVVFTPTYFTAAAPIDSDGFRFILGASSGEFFILLLLINDNQKVYEMKFEKLGRTSIASCLAYIDDGYVYVGSQHGDSQLVQLSTERIITDTKEVQFLKVVHTFPSLSPLNDFTLIRSSEMSDQNVLIASGGSAKDGAIKVISSGIDAVTVMSAELESINSGIEGENGPCSIIPSAIFSFRAGRPGDSLNHTHLAISSLGQTLTYSVDPVEGSLEEVTWGLHSTTETLNLVQLESGHLPQITCNGIYLGYSGSISCGGMWNCKPNESVLLSSNHENYVLLAMSDYWVRLFHVTPSGFSVVASAQFSSEVSCMKIFKARDGSLMAAVSFWDMSSFGFLTFNAKDKSVKFTQIDHSFVRESVIRSVQILESPSSDLFALFGGGNGKILISPIPRAAESSVEIDKICLMRLGTNPVTIFPFDDRFHVIAQSDRPYHITWHKSSPKLICSAINIPSFDSMTQFNFGDQAGFVTIKGNEIRFSYLQQSHVPKVNIKTIPIGKSIHRLIHLPHYKLFAAILHNFPVMIVPMSHWPLLRSELVLIDEETFEIVDRYQLEESDGNSTIEENGNLMGRFAEIGWSVAFGELEGPVDSSAVGNVGKVLVLGTSLTNDEPKDEKGRILVFKIGEGNRLKLTSTNEMKGGVRVVSICQGFVIGCVRGLNVVYKWDYQVEKKLVKSSSSGGHIDGTCVSQLDNILCFGDSLTSVSFCHLNRETLKISEFARDFQDNYITSLQLIDHSSVIAADLTGNLMTFQVIRDEALDMNAAICEGNIHLGDQINKILLGDLRIHPTHAQKSFMAVSSTGSLYFLHKIESDLYKKLLRLQKNLLTLLKPIGGIKHADFRKFYNGERMMKASQGFIDGDLLIRFTGLNLKSKQEVLGLTAKSTSAEKIGFTIDEATQIIESLSYGI
jgi:DNA damage-binding protein 1